MKIVDFLKAWWLSVKGILEPRVVGRFERWPDDGGMSPVCGLFLRRDAIEAELLVFATSEAELAYLDASGSLVQDHLDDLRSPRAFGEALSRMIGSVISR